MTARTADPARPVHLTLCVEADGSIHFYSTGDPLRLLQGLKLAVRTFTEHPQTMRCAVGACDGACGHAIRAS